MICIVPYLYQTAVTYTDIGPDQLLSHRGLLRILQEAAAIASDDCGYGIKDIGANGVFWILTGWRVELLERVSWRTALSVETWPRSLDGFLSGRDFLVYAQGRLIARATSRWFLVSASTGRIARITDKVKSAYELDQRAVFDTPIPSNGKSPEDARETFSTVVGRRDIDTNHHVNNIHYWDYALEALPEAVARDLPAMVEVVFRRQILLGTPIRCLYSVTAEGKHQVEIQSGEGKDTVHHAYLWFY